MFLPFWLLFQITALGVASASRILVDSNIHQTVPPTARFGVNYGAFDQGAGLYWDRFVSYVTRKDILFNFVTKKINLCKIYKLS